MGNFLESSDNCAGQKLDLSGPCSIIGFDSENALIEPHRSDVRSNVRADSIGPLSENTANLNPIGPAQRFHDSIE